MGRIGGKNKGPGALSIQLWDDKPKPSADHGGGGCGRLPPDSRDLRDMTLDKTAIINQIDTLLERCARLQERTRYDDFSDLPEDEVSEAVNLLLAATERLAPVGTSYRRNAKQYEPRPGDILGNKIPPLRGILRALRTDYAAGNLQSVVELVHAEVFADFLEMADYLLQQGYKDAAAVIVGSVLEEHLRKLCQKNSIAFQAGAAPKKADTLNSELAGAGVYSKLDQKSVTAWLDLRNKAAHGRYDEYAKEQVALTLQGVRDFASRFSA
jgi:uncharacterized protein (DUF2164 family)